MKTYIVKYLNEGHLLSDGSHTAEFSYESIARKRFMNELKTKSDDKLLLLECNYDNILLLSGKTFRKAPNSKSRFPHGNWLFLFLCSGQTKDKGL